VRKLDFAPVAQPAPARPRDEAVQHRALGLLGVLRLPALVAQVLDEVLDEVLHGAR
jgi:hypothetical protein